MYDDDDSLGAGGRSRPMDRTSMLATATDDELAMVGRLAAATRRNRTALLISLPLAIALLVALSVVVGDATKGLAGALGLDRALMSCGGHSTSSEHSHDDGKPKLEAKSVVAVVKPFNLRNSSMKGEELYPFMDENGNIKSDWVLNPRMTNDTAIDDLKVPDGTEAPSELMRYWAHRALHFERLYNTTRKQLEEHVEAVTLRQGVGARADLRAQEMREDFTRFEDVFKDVVVVNDTNIDFGVPEDADASDCIHRAKKDLTVESNKLFWERCMDVWSRQADALRTKGATATADAISRKNALDRCETHVKHRCQTAEAELEAVTDSVRGHRVENEALERAAKDADAALFRMTNLQLRAAMKRRDTCIVERFFWDGVEETDPVMPYLAAPPRRADGKSGMISSIEASDLAEDGGKASATDTDGVANKLSAFSLGSCPTHASAKHGHPKLPEDWTLKNDLKCVGPFDPLGTRPKPWGMLASRELRPHATWLSLCMENATNAAAGNALAFPPGEVANHLGPYPIDLLKPELVFGVLALHHDEAIDDRQVNNGLRETWLSGRLKKADGATTYVDARRAFGVYLVHRRPAGTDHLKRHGAAGRRSLLKSRKSKIAVSGEATGVAAKATYEDGAQSDKLLNALVNEEVLPEVRPFTEKRGGELDRIAQGPAKSASLALASVTYLRYRLDSLGCPKWVSLIETTTHTQVKAVAQFLSFLDPDQPIIAGRTRRVAIPKPGDPHMSVASRAVNTEETGDPYDPPGYQRVISTATGVYLSNEAMRRMTTAIESGLCSDGWPSAAEALSSCARVAEVDFVELPGMYDLGPHDVFNATRLEQLGPLFFAGGSQREKALHKWSASQTIGVDANKLGEFGELAEVYEPTAFAGIGWDAMRRWYNLTFCHDVMGSLRGGEVAEELDALIRHSPPPPQPPGVDEAPWHKVTIPDDVESGDLEPPQ